MNKIAEVKGSQSIDKNPMATQDMIHIIYGTQTGTSMMLAEDLEEQISALGLQTRIEDTEDFDVDSLPEVKKLLIVVSTYGGEEGEPPLMAEDLLEFLQSDEVPDLSHLSYSVLALGDSSYEHFCKAGIDFDDALAAAGADRMVERVDCDADYEDGFELWMTKVLEALKSIKKTD